MQDYFKKFSFGISLEISMEEYDKIINKYKQYIKSVYFSLPYGNEFHTRKGVVKEYNNENAKKKLIRILKLFQNNGIELEVVINQYNIDKNKLINALSEFNKFIKVDSICCLDEYLSIITKYYRNKIIYSFNNMNLQEKNIDKISQQYDMVVISRKFLRNVDMLKKIKDRGLETKILLNNGCSFNCFSCRLGSEKCKEVFDKELLKNTAQELYAKQSFFPWELKKLFEEQKKLDIDVIDELKISNRPCTFEYLDDCLGSYIYNKDEKSYIYKTYKNYHLWGRQSNLTPFFKEFELEEINKIKLELWKK